MQKFQDAITVKTAFGTVYVSQEQAVALLGVHPKTAERWARGTQRMSPERAALLAILSGQILPFHGWDGFTFHVKRGPPPARRPFAVLRGPDGREWLPDDFAVWYPVRGCR